MGDSNRSALPLYEMSVKDIAIEIKHPKKAPKRVLLTKMVSKVGQQPAHAAADGGAARVDSSSAAPSAPVERLPPPVE
jgi:hypothetical protein